MDRINCITPTQPRFQGGLLRAFVSTFYEKGEGVRYVTEQTGAFTMPRFIQQLNRTRSITGERNRVAGYEILARDLAADFTDTFLPGLLATFAIGSVVDKAGKLFGRETLVRRNMGHQALGFYEQVAKSHGETPKAFYQAIEKALGAGTGVDLEKLIRQPDPVKAAQTLAQRLKMASLDATLTHSTKTLSITLDTLIQDLQHLRKINSTQWVQTLQKTARLSRFQMIGNFIALGSSLAIPFVIRLATRRYYGKDAFPGSKALEDHFKGIKHHSHQHEVVKHKKFEPFPYIQKSLREGNYLPLAVTAGFFGVLATAVTRRFQSQGASLRKFGDWIKVYEFDRNFPWTTLKQMELTYGILCGTRLAASRNDAEFRETAIRDCFLGWPTLTYFYKYFREGVSGKLNQTLTKRFVYPHLLLKANGEVRAGHELTEALLKNTTIPKTVLTNAVNTTRRYCDQVTLLSAAVSWLLLAYAEPSFGIWLTNKLEVKRIRKELAQLKKQPEKDIPNTPLLVASPKLSGSF